MLPEHALQVAEASRVCAKLNLTWRTAGSRNWETSLVYWLNHCLSKGQHRALAALVLWRWLFAGSAAACSWSVISMCGLPAAVLACMLTLLALICLLRAWLFDLTVSQHVHLFPRCSAPCRILNLFRNTPLHRPLHMECCPVSFVPPKKYCAADVGSALPMAARTPAGLDEVPAADAEHRFAYAAGLPRWRTWHRLL